MYVNDINRDYTEVLTATTWCNGMMTNVYQYDPYGQVTYGSTEHEDFYAYNGESYNPNSGLVYLRARYYNANQGRFFQEDTYLGEIIDPLTLNRYAYVKNSPLNYVDPSGHVPVSMTGGHMPVGTSQTGSRRVAENNAKTTQNPAYQGGILEEEMERAEESGEYKDCVRAVIRSIIKNPDADRAIWKMLLPLGDIREDFSAIGDRYLKYIYGIDNVADTKESYQIRLTVYEILWEAEINGVDVNSMTNREIDSLFVPYFSKRVEEAYQIADVAIATFASVAQSKLMEYCQWKVAEQAVESDLGTIDDPIGINKQKILDVLKDAPVEYRKNPNTGLMEPYMKQAQITDDYKVILRRNIGDFSNGDLDHWNLEVQTIHSGNMNLIV